VGIFFSAAQVEFEAIQDEWWRAVQALAKRGVFVGGTAVSSFEERFASYVGTDSAVGVGNGTDALHLALKALCIGPGDEVITAANTFIATVEAIAHTGATPVLVDCDPKTMLIDLEQVKQRVTARTKAIIPVHLYGQMVDLRELEPWAREREIAIVEDSAQAAGASLHGRRAGSIGVLGCFSFYPDKNLGALGDAGGVTTSDGELLSRLRKLRNHGGETRYQHDIVGYNSRLDPLQAIALELKLKRLDEWNEIRRSAARLYEAYLSDLGGVQLPAHRGDESHVFHVYAVQVEQSVRDRLRKHLQKKGILTAVHYPLPVHLTGAFASLDYGPGDFPNAERAAKMLVSLPMHIALTEQDIAWIGKEVRGVLGGVQV
jgi:dTDP-4-amino-4,6-dideoxygalactose transaminase